MKKLLKNKKVFVMAMALVLAVGFAGIAGATPPEASGLTLNFDVSQMFIWTQAMLDMMLPVVYITLGIALAFLVLRSLKSAFN